jgi:phosphatidylglycerol lysyltransferase
MPKGFALVQAFYLLVLAVLLYLSRAQFDRRSSLFSTPLRGVWLISVVWVVAATVFLLFFAYRRVDYSNELWWQFEFNANAPRSLRAMMGVMVAGLGVALWQLLRPSPGAPALPSVEELDRASNIVRNQPSAEANLALMGDKRLLFSTSGNAFIMYGRQGRSWISLFDPVGRQAEWQELIWRFIELATDHGGRAAFYQVRGDSLPLYLDAGMRAYKLGEYAYVQLQEFTTKGSKRSHLRQAINRGERDGLEFALVPPEEVSALLPQLRAVSDAWLEGQDAREKGFSLAVVRDRAAAGADRRLRQFARHANEERSQRRSDASVAARAAGHDGLPVHQAHVVFPGRGLFALRLGDGAHVGHGESRAGAALASVWAAAVRSPRVVL